MIEQREFALQKTVEIYISRQNRPFTMEEFLNDAEKIYQWMIKKDSAVFIN